MSSSSIRREIKRWQSTYDKLNTKYRQTNDQYLDCYDRIAKILLLEGAKHIPHAPSQQAMRERIEKYKNLLKKQKQLVRKQEEYLADLAAIKSYLIDLQPILEERLLSEPFLQLESVLQQEWGAYEVQEAIWQKTTNDILQLLQTYSENRYYRYLKKRKYSAEKRVSFLDFQGKLDRWLANKIHFSDNRHKEELLLRSKAYGDSVHIKFVEQLGLAEQEFDRALSAVTAEIGITDAVERRSDLEAELQKIGDMQEVVASALNEIEQNTDAEFKRIYEMFQEGIRHIPTREVQAAVKASATKEDDHWFAESQRCKIAMESIKKEMSSARTRIRTLEQEYNTAVYHERKIAEERERQNRQKEASSGSLAGSLIGGVLGGVMSSGGSFGGGGSRSSSSFGGGGSRSSSSFGGGGSRTTDRF